jgi:hypothetical protein
MPSARERREGGVAVPIPHRDETLAGTGFRIALKWK